MKITLSALAVLAPLTLCLGMTESSRIVPILPPSDEPVQLPLIPLADPAVSAAPLEGLRVLTTPAAYVALFGHRPPAAIDWQSEWVVYFSGGLHKTAGYVASIESATFAPGPAQLLVKTLLLEPDGDCDVGEGPGAPFALARLVRPYGMQSMRWQRTYGTLMCAQ